MEESQRTMVNKYAGTCSICGGYVAKHAGELQREGGLWQLAHLACRASGQAEVISIRFSSGAVMYQNRRGRCEDASCCGCCS